MRCRGSRRDEHCYLTRIATIISTRFFILRAAPCAEIVRQILFRPAHHEPGLFA